MSETLEERAAKVASAIWEDVDWLEDQERIACRDGIGVPASLIGEATRRIAAKIAAFARDEGVDA
jgi:hypothetical protein